MRIAIIGTGVAGLTSAYLLSQRHDVTVFEADDRPGGHANTVRVEFDGETHNIDTGFIVYNERNYPGLVKLFERLKVETKPSDMSFSMSDELSGLEWRGTSFSTVFAQRRNLASLPFQRMLVDVARFNRAARKMLDADETGRESTGGELTGAERGGAGPTVGEMVVSGKWSKAFAEWYLVPLASSIWSARPEAVMDFPVKRLARFFDNHGLLSFGDQPKWRTVSGGSASYVKAITGPLGRRLRLGTPVAKLVRRSHGVELATEDGGSELFDHVVVATHSDQALRLLSDAAPAEQEVLGAIAYQPNVAILHTDERLLPRNPRARASWNYHRMPQPGDATLTYDLNRLQGIESRHRYCVTLNRADYIDPAKVLASIEYAHPVFDSAAIAAQARYGEISGRNGIWYCGAYWNYGFHEDGLQSALRVCRAFGTDL